MTPRMLGVRGALPSKPYSITGSAIAMTGRLSDHACTTVCLMTVSPARPFVKCSFLEAAASRAIFWGRMWRRDKAAASSSLLSAWRSPAYACEYAHSSVQWEVASCPTCPARGAGVHHSTSGAASSDAMICNEALGHRGGGTLAAAMPEPRGREGRKGTPRRIPSPVQA